MPTFAVGHKVIVTDVVSGYGGDSSVRGEWRGVIREVGEDGKRFLVVPDDWKHYNVGNAWIYGSNIKAIAEPQTDG